MKRFLLVLSITLTLADGLLANPIVPVSYEYINGRVPYQYWDDTGGQLTDGLYNALIPHVNLAVPDAFNWVAFGGAGEVTFNFASNVTIQNISVSMARWEPAAVYLPSSILVNGTPHAINAGSYVDTDHALIDLNGSWTGSALTLYFTSAGQWTFLDEVTFDGSSDASPVPEAGSTLALVGATLLGLLAVRRRSRLS